MGDVIKVTKNDIINGDASFMFKDVTADKIDLRNIEISSLINKESMFENAKINSLYLPDYSMKVLLEGNAKHIFKNAVIEHIKTYQTGKLEIEHLLKLCEGFIRRTNIVGIGIDLINDTIKQYWSKIKSFYSESNLVSLDVTNSKYFTKLEFYKFNKVPYLYMDRKYNLEEIYLVYSESCFTGEDNKVLSNVTILSKEENVYNIYIPNIFEDYGTMTGTGYLEMLYLVFSKPIESCRRQGYAHIVIRLHGTIPMVARDILDASYLGSFKRLDLSDVTVKTGSYVDRMIPYIRVGELILHENMKKKASIINEMFGDFDIGKIIYVNDFMQGNPNSLKMLDRMTQSAK